MTGRLELLISFIVVALLLAGYAIYAQIGELAGGDTLGLWLGLTGLVLMLITEIVYTVRKRLSRFQLGRLRLWLSFHIFTGIVGPCLVLLHSAFSFRGFAGVALLLTLIVVISGFVGRYIYTAVPRTMAGAVVVRKTLISQITMLQAELDQWSSGQSSRVQGLVAHFKAAPPDKDISMVGLLTRFLSAWHFKRQVQQALRALEPAERQRIHEMASMLRRQRELDRQITSLRTAQRLLRRWHRLHVPLGLTMFTAIAIHIGATIYFGALTN
jgi:hypothetical protein